MTSPPYMPLYVGDYLGDTLHLSRCQHGSYLLLIIAYWKRQRPLPDDDAFLARIAGATKREWAKDRATLAAFFEVEGGVWRHKRIDAEIEKFASRREQQSRAGKASSEGRKSNEINAPSSTSVERTLQHPFNHSTSISDSNNNLGQQPYTGTARGADAAGADAPGCPKSNIIDLKGATTRADRRPAAEIRAEVRVRASARRIGIPEDNIDHAFAYARSQGAAHPAAYAKRELAGHARDWLRKGGLHADYAGQVDAALSGDETALRAIEDGFRQLGLPPGQTLEGRAAS